MTPAVVTAIGTVTGALISGIVALIVSGHQHSKALALIDYRIGQLEEKQDKHNSMIERMYVVERDMKTAFNRVDELRSDLKEVRSEAIK